MNPDILKLDNSVRIIIDKVPKEVAACIFEFVHIMNLPPDIGITYYDDMTQEDLQMTEEEMKFFTLGVKYAYDEILYRYGLGTSDGQPE